jgi:deazaflavin-dependent oxidoreductase (nitroreductase family)
MAFPRILSRIHTNFINKAARRVVGRSAIADLEHVGRTSGKLHHTPVRAFRTGDTVVIGINFGPRSDWLRNVLATGHGRMRLREQVMELDNPRVVPIEQGMKRMPRAFGFGLRYVVRTRQCLELSVVSTAPGHEHVRLQARGRAAARPWRRRLAG